MLGLCMVLVPGKGIDGWWRYLPGAIGGWEREYGAGLMVGRLHG